MSKGHRYSVLIHRSEDQFPDVPSKQPNVKVSQALGEIKSAEPVAAAAKPEDIALCESSAGPEPAVLPKDPSKPSIRPESLISDNA